jgi:hypothetical protein
VSFDFGAYAITAWHKIAAITAGIYDRRNGVDRHFAWQQSSGPNVRFGSKADIGGSLANVRFTPKSGHWNSVVECLLCAKSGLMHGSKNFVICPVPSATPRRF